MTTAAPDAVTVAALQTALATEHAAVWCYGLVTAFVPGDLATQVAEAALAHRARRDATERVLADAGVTPVPAEPAYRTPWPVTDTASAVALTVTAESDTAEAWRSVIERAGGPQLRSSALTALVGAAVRAARWRQTGGAPLLTVPFPGAP
ncbi:MAG: ferritin-like domain-containing protein [Pseudonocardiaceae bacterium]